MCVQPAQASLDANHASSKIIHPSHTDLILDILLKGSNEQFYKPESKFQVRIKSKYHQSQIQIPK